MSHGYRDFVDLKNILTELACTVYNELYGTSYNEDNVDVIFSPNHVILCTDTPAGPLYLQLDADYLWQRFRENTYGIHIQG